MLPESLESARTMLLNTIRRTLDDNQDPNVAAVAQTLWTAAYSSFTNHELAYHYLALSMDQPKRVAYASKPGYTLDVARRTHTTLQRYLIRQLKVIEGDITEATVARYATLFWSYLGESPEQFTIVRGAAVTKRYEEEFGDSSCMCGRRDVVQLYELNTMVVGMLCYDGVHGQARALLWTCDSGETVVDRIYPNSGSHISVIQRHATSQGWLYRIHNGAPEYGLTFTDGNGRQTDRLTVTVNPAPPLWPYLDSFRYTDDIKDRTTLSIQKKVILFNNTDGTHDNSSIVCTECGNPYDEDDMSTIHGYSYCINCRDEMFGFCDHCGEYYNIDETTYVQYVGYLCPQCLEASYSACDQCCTYVKTSECIRQPSNEILCQSCHEEHINELEETPQETTT